MLQKRRSKYSSNKLKKTLFHRPKWFFFSQKAKQKADPVDAARAAFYTDGVEASNYKFDYDSEA